MEPHRPVHARIQLERPGTTAVLQNPNEQAEGRGRHVFPLFFLRIQKKWRLLFNHPTWGCLNLTEHHLGSGQDGRGPQLLHRRGEPGIEGE